MYSSGDINKIKNIESRKNFEDVLQSFYSKNYKACILLLYNLVVNDMYSKLILMDENKYINCRNEIEYIENILKENDESKYSVVEEKVFETYKSKKILNHSTIELLRYFKKIRNKCAHPIFYKESDYTPTEEEVYLFIKKIYDDILIIDAFFKEPYKVMKEDIDKYQFPSLDLMIMGISNIQEDTEKVKKYFENKYFRFMTEHNYIKLFRSLIDLSITKNNDEILRQQYSHFLILNSLLEYLSYHGKLSILNGNYDWSKITAENIHDDYNKKTEEQLCFSLTYLLSVLKTNHTFVEELKNTNEDVYTLVEKSLYKNSYLFKDYWMIFDSDINKAAKKIPDDLYYYNYCQLIEKLEILIDRNILLELIEKMISKIPTFNAFDAADRCIEIFLKIMTKANPKYEQELLKKIFDTMNKNRQIYDKCRSSRNNQLNRIKELGYSLDKYDNLQVEEGDK